MKIKIVQPDTPMARQKLHFMSASEEEEFLEEQEVDLRMF